jgi:hypothetical protein
MRENTEKFLIAPILEKPSSQKFKNLTNLIPTSQSTASHQYSRAPLVGIDGELVPHGTLFRFFFF